MKAAPPLKPNRWRRQHDQVDPPRAGEQLLDAAGQICSPYRVVDTLGLMLRRGTITLAMYDAGNTFRTLFAVAQLDTLRAAALDRVIVDHAKRGGVGARAIAASDEVWRQLRMVGGIDQPGGRCLWHVLGWGQSLSEWAALQGWCGQPIDVREASGILKTALGVLSQETGGRR